MNMPNFKMDWTINIGQVVAFAVFILSGVGAWYDVKTDVKVNRAYADEKFKMVEQFMDYQKKTDTEQDRQRERTADEIHSSLKDISRDIKSDIRDLRNDILRKR